MPDALPPIAADVITDSIADPAAPKAPPADPAVVRAAWRAAYGPFFGDAEAPYRVALAYLAVSRRRALGWLLLGHDGLVRWGEAPVEALGEAGARQAAADGALVLDHGQRTPTPGIERIQGALPVPDKALRRALRGGTEGLERAEAQAALVAFVAALDPEVVAQMRAIRQGVGLVIYNFLAGHRPGTEGAEAEDGPANAVRSARRRQAAALYPMFWKQVRGTPALIAVVDEGRELIPALARHNGVRGATVRALAGWPFGPATCNLKALPDVLALADVTPPEWLPRTPEDWQAFTHCCGFITSAARLALSPVNEPRTPRHADMMPVRAARLHAAAAFLRRTKGQWRETAQLLGRCGGFRDIPQAMVREVVLPVIAARRGVHDAMRWMHDSDIADFAGAALLTRLSPAALVRLDAAWHERFGAPRAGAAPAAPVRRSESTDEPWSRLGDDAVAPNGLRVRNLCTPAELAAESDRMKHCVRTYTWQCRIGGSRILSVEAVAPDGTATGLSTAEVAVFGKLTAPQVRVVQHRAVRNTAPGAEAEAALRWYLAALANGAVPGRLAELAEETAGAAARRVGVYARTPEDQLRNLCGFDPSDHEARLAMWRDWSHLLGGGAERQSPEEWLLGLPDAVYAATVSRTLTGLRRELVPAPASLAA